jgi:hypothetical protein
VHCARPTVSPLTSKLVALRLAGMVVFLRLFILTFLHFVAGPMAPDEHLFLNLENQFTRDTPALEQPVHVLAFAQRELLDDRHD